MRSSSSAAARSTSIWRMVWTALMTSLTRFKGSSSSTSERDWGLSAMPDSLLLLAALIAVALIFDFLNGLHDAANSIATVVSTRVLSPNVAVVWAAFFNFIAAFVLGTHVAKTIGSGMIDLKAVTQEVILAGLIGASTWNLITWYYGRPV